MTALPERYAEEKRRIEDSLKLLHSYSWLLDSFVLDFYTDKHWEKLPIKWRNLFDIVEIEELGSFLDYRKENSCLQRVWPLSLLALRTAAHTLSVTRRQIESLKQTLWNTNKHSQEGCYLSLNKSYNEFIEREISLQVCNEQQVLGNEFLNNTRFSHVFLKHVKPKKRHEVALMAKITAETAKLTRCSYIVDVGSGLGHLARMLAYGYDMKVCCLEAQSNLAKQARKLDLQLEVTVSKYDSNGHVKFCRPVHMSDTLDPSVDADHFIQILKTAFGLESDDFNFGIVGLHPCGDLGPTLLHLLVKCSNAKFINIVGCCYMKLTTTIQSNMKFRGYPLSKFISKLSYGLSYEAREIACHAIENYYERLCTGDISHLKVHCYRATLERILVKFWPNLRHSGIRSIRNASTLSFDKYCHAATERLGVVLPEDELSSKETWKELSQWKRVVIFYSLRLLLAPLVETVLLMDRLFYVMESGLNGTLMPVFSPSLSPRNHILIAMKQVDN